LTDPIAIDGLDALAALLSEAKTLAVVGLSDDPSRDSHSVTAYLQRSGYRILGVNPAHGEVLGEPCYPSLSDIPEGIRATIDLVVVFRRPAAVPPIIEEAARLGLRRVWLQIGVSSPIALETASRLGVGVVPNKCIRVVHGLLRARLGRSSTEATDSVGSAPPQPSRSAEA
jgi:hypothetical protein